MNTKTIFVCLTIVALFVAAHAKDGEDSDKRGSRKSDDQRREVDVEVKSYEFKIESVSRSNGTRNKYEFECKLEGLPRIRVRKFTKTSDGAAGFSFRMGIRRVVEFVDNGTDANVFDASDVIVSSFSLIGRKTLWQQNWATQTGTTASGANYHKFCNSLLRNGGANGNFTLCMRIADQVATDVDSVTLSPDTLKIDIGMQNYPYAQTGTKLALIAFVQAKEKSSKSDTTTITVGKDGSFTWASSATNSTNTIAIGASLTTLAVATRGEGQNDGDDDDNSSEESVQAVAFTFQSTERLANLYWDPEIGVSSASAIKISLLVLASLASLLFALF